LKDVRKVVTESIDALNREVRKRFVVAKLWRDIADKKGLDDGTDILHCAVQCCALAGAHCRVKQRWVLREITYRPLVHHIWSHAEKYPLEVSSLAAVAENFAPTWFFLRVLSCDVVQDFCELTFDFLVIVRQIKQSADNMSGLVLATMLCKPPGSFWEEEAEDKDDQAEEDLACDRKSPLHGTVGVQGCEAKPGCNGDTDDDQSCLNDHESTPVMRWKSLGL